MALCKYPISIIFINYHDDTKEISRVQRTQLLTTINFQFNLMQRN